jgi:hypothetical protein
MSDEINFDFVEQLVYLGTSMASQNYISWHE